MIYWQNIESEIVDMIKNPKFPTIAMSENEFYSTANHPSTGMFIVSPSEGGDDLPSRDTFAFVSIFNPEIIEYNNGGVITEYKVRVIHAMRMTGLDQDVKGAEWFEYTLYKSSDEGWETPVKETNRSIYPLMGYTADWISVDTKIINNLTEGGEENALSAEMGKELKALIDAIKPFSETDKIKLDGIEEGANKYILPNATTSTLGGVMPDGTSITVDENGIISVEDVYMKLFNPERITIYFDTVNGDDSNTGFTSTSPKKSAQEYIASLNGEHLVSEHRIYIINEDAVLGDIELNNISGAKLTLSTGSSNKVFNVNGIVTVRGCSNYIYLNCIVANNGFKVIDSLGVKIQQCKAIEPAIYGYYCSNSTVACVTCATENVRNSYYAMEHTRLFVSGATGAFTNVPNNSMGYGSLGGSEVRYYYDRMTGINTKSYTGSGGTVTALSV